MSLITVTHFDRSLVLPIALPQTELRASKSLQVATWRLALGQRIELRSLHLHLIKLLTPGVDPQLNNSTHGIVSVGIYASTMATSAIGVVLCIEPGVAALTGNDPVHITTPGDYNVVVSNNSINVDVSVAVTGAARFSY